MTPRNFDEMSKADLVRELEKLQTAERRLAAASNEADPQRLIHDLHVHQVELEMQNRELRDAQELLEESRSRYADLYDFAPVGYCTLDREGFIREINLTGSTLLGAPREELVGRPLWSAPWVKDRQPFLAHMKRCAQENTRVTGELVLSRARRGQCTIQIISDPVRDASGTTAYRTVLVDISQRKRLENQLRLLSEAGETLAASLDYTTTLEAAARIVVPGLADLCMVDVLGGDGEVERLVVVFADAKKQKTLADRLKDYAPRPGWQTPQARVIESGEPMLLSEMSDQQSTQIAYDDGYADTLRLVGIRSLMIVPLSAHGRTLGAVTFASAESERRYSLGDLGLARDLASRTALALDNARLYAEAQRANQALALAEAKSSGILSISTDAIISVDENQRITLFNEGAEQIFGYAGAEVIGEPLDILIPEALRAIHRHRVARFGAGELGARQMGERGAALLGLRKDGQEFPADAAISKLEVGGKRILTVALRDVTEQKQIEKGKTFLADVGLVLANTLDYEQTLARLVELALRDLADGCIIDILGKDGELSKWIVVCRDPSKAEICASFGHTPLDRRHPHLTSSALETGRSVIMERLSPEMVASFAESERHLRLLRAIDPRSVIAVPLLVHGKLLGAMAFVSSDPSRVYGPSDLRLAEELAQRGAMSITNAELYRAAERAIQARDEMLGVVAHDLRNPLNVIVLQATMLQHRAPEGDHWSRKPAAVIAKAVARMNHLIQDLLEVTRMESGHLAIARSRVAANGVASDALAAQAPLAAAAFLELRLDAAPDLPELWADRDRLLQVFENLIGNAMKFSQSGGRIVIGVARGEGEGEVLFRVNDTGAGIAAEDLPRVFDRFWQAQKTGDHGAGLGLSIVKGIIDAHGGRIWVESTPGSGSTFFFTVPVAQPVQAPHQVERSDERHQAGQ